MGESLARFRQAASRRSLQPAEVALDERLTDIRNGIAVLGQPPAEVIAASHITPDTVLRIPLLVQYRGKLIEVGTQWATSKPVDRRCARKVCLDHKPLLLFYGDVEKEKHRTA
jgi:hypothetical protein